jgi:hypothetical protein
MLDSPILVAHLVGHVRLQFACAASRLSQRRRRARNVHERYFPSQQQPRIGRWGMHQARAAAGGMLPCVRRVAGPNPVKASSSRQLSWNSSKRAGKTVRRDGGNHLWPQKAALLRIQSRAFTHTLCVVGHESPQSINCCSSHFCNTNGQKVG